MSSNDLTLLESDSTALVFLLANNMGLLAEVTIRRALENSKCPVFLGYVDEKDLTESCFDSRVTRIQLASSSSSVTSAVNVNREYSDFSTNDFFQIVTLKWDLLEWAFSTDVKYLIYSDLDVLWISNPIPKILSAFIQDEDLDVQIQSFSSDPDDRRLCMGFVALRVGDRVMEFTNICRNLHIEALMLNKKYGDDDAVNDFYREAHCPAWIKELPQPTFPVGNLANTFSKRDVFPGLRAPVPYIYHANFVVGLQSKLMLLHVISEQYSLRLFGFWKRRELSVLVFVKRLKHAIARRRNLHFFQD